MKKFHHVYASSVREATSLLAEHGAKARVIAGGSDQLRWMKDRLETPEVLVNVSRIPDFERIEWREDGLHLGARTRVARLAADPLVQERYSVLAQAAAVVASPQIRNVASVAGDLLQRPWCYYFREGFPCLRRGGTTCYSPTGDNAHHAIIGGNRSFIVHDSDLGPALVALGANITLASARGTRTLALEDFYILPAQDVTREYDLAPDELVTEIHVPTRWLGASGTYTKIRQRGSWDHGIVTVAAVGRVRDGALADVSIVLGGIAPKPWRVTEAEDLLRGQPVQESLAADAGAAALANARPLSRNAYKVGMARDAIRDTVMSLT
ncbi:MAG TPA: FAD binding domain-containing protein [Chloroflexota bacterium]|jgi:xanthine dehydrogenase YagS FAD-binding subunit